MVAKQAGFDLDTILPMKEAIKETADNFNLTTRESDDQEDVKAMKDELTQELQGMLKSTQGAAPMMQEGQPASPQG